MRHRSSNTAGRKWRRVVASGRVVSSRRFPCWLSQPVGRVEPGQAGTVFVSPGRPRSCPRGSSCKAPFPRFPATEAVDKSAPRAATTLEFECERICRQHGVNTGPSHRRKWPYNLSPSGRGAINRAALSANELLLPLPLPHPERES